MRKTTATKRTATKRTATKRTATKRTATAKTWKPGITSKDIGHDAAQKLVDNVVGKLEADGILDRLSIYLRKRSKALPSNRTLAFLTLAFGIGNNAGYCNLSTMDVARIAIALGIARNDDTGKIEKNVRQNLSDILSRSATSSGWSLGYQLGGEKPPRGQSGTFVYRIEPPIQAKAKKTA